MKKMAALSLLVLLALLCALPAGASMNKYQTTFYSFDTVITMIGFAPDEATFSAWSAASKELFAYMHKLFDAYHSYEDEGIVSVYTLNQRAAIEPVRVDPILFGLLTFCQGNYELCGGQTNIAMGSMLGVWHDYREDGLNDPENAKLPPMDLLTAANEHTNMDDLILDPENMTVYFADPNLKIDLGAAAKGYATEIVAQMLLGGEMPSFIISAGGNVRVGQKPQDGRGKWGVGLQDPDSFLGVAATSDIVETLYLTDMSVVTSGDYQRYYTVDGVRYHHLIDPDTLMPGSYYRAVSIITQDSGLADILSTAAFLMPYEESRAFIESLEGVDAIWILPDGSIEMTDGAMKVAKSCGATNK